MDDPLLLAHQVALFPGFFNIAGRLWPVGIRDQMVRAVELVDRLVTADLVGGDRGALLVVGAGPAGATAAMRAAEQGVATLLVERGIAPFMLQRNCRTRWIDPTQYDWPADHWTVGACPFVQSPCPLPWTSDWSHQLAARWEVMLNLALAQFPWFSAWYSVWPTAYESATWGWRVEFNGTADSILLGNQTRHFFGAVVWATGFGTEKCCVDDNFCGFRFWEADPLSLPNLGLPDRTTPRVIISGGGDGALQDFLRITTGLKSAEEIYGELPFPRHFGRRIYTAEDSALRSFQWAATVKHDHTCHDVLHRAHIALVNDAWGMRGMVQALAKLLPEVTPHVTMVHSCSHFGKAYGLNRFLTLLIARFLERRLAHRQVLFNNARVGKVKSADRKHKCSKKPTQCHGIDHEVELEEAPDCGPRPQKPQVVQTLRANVIIVRHGIDEQEEQEAPQLPDIAHPRQLLPFRAFG